MWSFLLPRYSTSFAEPLPYVGAACVASRLEETLYLMVRANLYATACKTLAKDGSETEIVR